MKKNKLVSVIIPFYNAEEYLDTSIKSVIDQTYKNIEILLIDDCSTDKSFKIAKKYLKKDSRIKVFKTKKNSGTVAVPRNIGIKKARGEYISFLDADDFWHLNKIELQLDKIDNNLLCSTACNYANNNLTKKSNIFLNYFRIFLQNFFFKKILQGKYHLLYIYNPVIVSSVLINRKLFKNNLFNEDITIREDLSFWLYIFKKKIKKKFIFINKITLTIRRANKSMSSNKIEEFVKIIKTLVNYLLITKDYKKFHYIAIGIVLRSLRFYLETFFIVFQKNIVKIVVLFIFFYFIIFYSPLFWYLGKPLLYKNSYVPKDLDNYVIFSGHGDTSYYNITYQYRYLDIRKILDHKKKINKIFLLGRLRDIPEQKIIEKLLISDGVDQKKIYIIYKNFENTRQNIDNVNKILMNEKISKIIFITSPYHSLRSKLLWQKNSKIKVYMPQTYEWPKKNNFFEYSKNKKIIIYEYLSILYNKLKGNI